MGAGRGWADPLPPHFNHSVYRRLQCTRQAISTNFDIRNTPTVRCNIAGPDLDLKTNGVDW